MCIGHMTVRSAFSEEVCNLDKRDVPLTWYCIQDYPLTFIELTLPCMQGLLVEQQESGECQHWLGHAHWYLWGKKTGVDGREG